MAVLLADASVASRRGARAGARTRARACSGGSLRDRVNDHIMFQNSN